MLAALVALVAVVAAAALLLLETNESRTVSIALAAAALVI